MCSMFGRKLVGAVVGMAAMAAVGCSGKGDCKKVVDHISALAIAELPPELQAQRTQDFEANKPDMIKRCEAEGLTNAQEACALKAKTLAELGACNQ